MIKKVVKRDKRIEDYNSNKIRKAILKAAKDVNELYPENIATKMSFEVEERLQEEFNEFIPEVEEIQDIVEDVLIENNYNKIAKAYILYRERMRREREEGWFDLEIGKTAWERKYRYQNEDFSEFLNRITNHNKEQQRIIRRKEFCPAGRILANRGVPFNNQKTTYANCYHIPIKKDSLEGIFKTAYEIARTFSYGGGAGTDISILRPRNARVNNAAKQTTGSISFMRLYNLVTDIIGQKNRRGALIMTLEVSHPDIEDFIEIKQDLNRITKANLSVKITDDFMEKARDDEKFTLNYYVKDTGESIEKEVNATQILNKIAYTNYDYAEPGALFWDNIQNWHIMSEHDEYELTGVNPCGERPLIDYGACALASVNLSNIVANPYTDEAEINEDKLKELTSQGVQYLNDVLDEGLSRHPLEPQKQASYKFRDIGLGVMGLADLFVKLGVRYGSEESKEISRKLGNIMINSALQQSALLAKKDGTFPAYNDSVLKSDFVLSNSSDKTLNLIAKYGLRNASLLSIAPTGTISQIFGVAGGIEPFFDISYTRKTESLGTDAEEYKVFTPTIRELMDKKGIDSEDKLPEYVVTTHDIDYADRIEIQAAWQQNIDNSISSTLNLNKNVSINDIKNAYIYGWEMGLKGMTVYRNGCKKDGILSNKDSHAEGATMIDFIDEDICPECQDTLIKSQGCVSCRSCGYSPCSI